MTKSPAIRGRSIVSGIEPETKQRFFDKWSTHEGAVIHGVFHGDFHAGNVFLSPSGKIGLVDFGITGKLEGERRLAFFAMVGLMTEMLNLMGGIKDSAFPVDSDIGQIISEFQLEKRL